MADEQDRQEYRVGELAAQLGVKPKTVRYYSEIGLLPAPRRSPAGHRLYGRRDRESLRFIVKAKAVGLSLREIREIVDLKNRGVRPCSHVRSLIDGKIEDVQRQIHAFEEYREALRQLQKQASAAGHDEGAVCGIIERHDVSRPNEVARATALSSRPRFSASARPTGSRR